MRGTNARMRQRRPRHAGLWARKCPDRQTNETQAGRRGAMSATPGIDGRRVRCNMTRFVEYEPLLTKVNATPVPARSV